MDLLNVQVIIYIKNILWAVFLEFLIQKSNIN